MKIALTIAGSDSGGGAGIQADIKTFIALGVFGTSVITAVTAQNTLGIQAVQPMSPRLISVQIASVVEDMGCDAVKCGMLVNAEIVQTVAGVIDKYGLRNFVLDPVISSSSGTRLLSDPAIDNLKTKLVPLATIITPNLSEAGILSDITVTSTDEMKLAAEIILKLGTKSVLVTGGHLKGDIVDVFYDGNDYHEFKSKRIKTRNTHGTGCTLSAAITAGLALGKSTREAVTDAITYTQKAIENSINIGHGDGTLSHLIRL